MAAPWDVGPGIDACRRVVAISARVADDQWRLLVMLSEGFSFEEMSNLVGGSPGALRTRVTRLRQVLRREAA